MGQEHCVIIGNGPAGSSAAMTLRNFVPDERITVIGDESVPEYRCDLLPDYIAGTLREEDLFCTPVELYREAGVKLRLGQRVIRVDLHQRSLLLDHNEVVEFTGLIVASGSKPSIPEPLGVFSDQILTLKTLYHARLWIEKLSHVDSVFVAGGDLTSLCLTRALLSLGKRVLFMLCPDSFWPVPFSSEVRDSAAAMLSEKGVEVLDCSKIEKLTRLSEHSVEVTTNSGILTVGVVGAFFGLVPNVAFLAGSGLDVDRGVLVDEYLKTRFDHVYAAGDCAQVYHPDLGAYWVSIGCENAREQGRIAAMNLLGGALSVKVPRERIFDVAGIKVNTSWWMEL